MNYFSGKRNSVVPKAWIVVAVMATTILLFGMGAKSKGPTEEIMAASPRNAAVVVNLIPMPRASQRYSVFTRVNTNKKVWL